MLDKLSWKTLLAELLLCCVPALLLGALFGYWSWFLLSINNLTTTNGRVIGYLLLNSDKEIFQKDIEALLELRRSTVSTLLQGMEAKGLIVREEVSYDARLKKIVPTETAYMLHEMIKETLIGFEEHLTSGVSEYELNIFISVLEKMQNNLD